uniref:NADH dehydrogenase subunit 5 n=1 Tax=Ciconiphilus decimfasciatus TaxID=2212705 RepID=UPI00257B7184|nr:NADH dehydrogenase subunit 5 [Ciconiphilus decimfasciatus]WGW14990.1 NADH dehydrogenase subunit 5 [Ciconiphilus decimfasciatus]
MTFCIYLYMYQNSYFMEWSILDIVDVEITIKLNYSSFNMIFIFTVLSVFASVYHYSMEYMMNSFEVKQFFIIMMTFVLSMLILICSGNMFTTLIGWDGLGITSMLLIMYYYSNNSLKASMYTFMINRLGDCFLLILICTLFCNFPDLSLFEKNLDIPFLVSFLIMTMAITKSAQIPFSSWLTKAMEAPTPVSSLVHSSTLVTAGIYVLFIYQELWKNNQMMVYTLLILSISTMIMASLMGLIEVDLKKIVAYSTLSQLGFIMFTFSIFLFEQGFFHLIMHAFFKALMFMSVGYVIHNSSGWQDIRMLTLNYSCSPDITKIFLIAGMSLCGMPFLSGFYSKDYIVDSLMMKDSSFFLMFLVFISFLLTLMYYTRMCWYVMSSMKNTFIKSSNMTMSMIYLLIFSCVMGSVIQWTMLPGFSAVNSSKITLIAIFTIVSVIYWLINLVKKTNFFLKTNLYLFVLVSLIVSWIMNLMTNLYWSLDLLNLLGKMVKTDNFFSKLKESFNEITFFMCFKELMFFGFFSMLFYVML